MYRGGVTSISGLFPKTKQMYLFTLEVPDF